MYKKVCITLILFFIILLNTPIYSLANSWVEDADKSIYERTYSDSQKEAATRELEGLDTTYTGAKGDILSSLFAKFFTSTGDLVYKLIAPMGFDMNSIIYGRVGGSAYKTDNISLFTYELSMGNIYGLVSMAIYNLLRSAVFVIMVCAFLIRLTAFIYSSGNAKARERIKDSSQKFIIMFLAMIIFPQILDLILYIRDCILYGEMEFGSALVENVGDAINTSWSSSGNGNIAFDFFGTGSSYSLIGTFRTIVENDMSLVNSVMYLGVVALQCYMGISYIGAAFSMVVLVILFPFCSILEMIQHTSVSTWIKQLLGIILNPILDSALLLIPMMFMLLGYDKEGVGYQLIALIACSCIIPARGVIRTVLGVGNGMGFELAGLGSLLGMMRLAGTVGRGVWGMASHLKEGMSSSKQDDEMADMYSEQARRQDLESVNEQNALQEDMESVFGLTGGRVDTGDIAFDSIPEESMADMSHEQKAMARQQNLENGLDALNIRKEQLNDEVRQGEMESNRLGGQMAEIDEHTAELRAKRTGYDPKDPEQQESIREIDGQIAENNIDRQRLALQQKQIQMENSQRKDQIGKIDTIERRTRTAQRNIHGSVGGSGGGGGMVSPAEQGILDQYANIDNFQMPEFRNISIERKAELYRERARKIRIKTAAAAAGSVAGGVALGSVALAGTSYFSPAATSYATALGLETGGAIGGGIGTVVGEKAASVTFPRGKEVKPIVETKNRGRVAVTPSITYEKPVGYIDTKARSSPSAPTYSDWDRHGTAYERQPTDYVPNWEFAEEPSSEARDRNDRNQIYNRVFMDLDRSNISSNMIKSMREASAVARQSFNTIRASNGNPRTDEEKSNYNERIVDEALEQYGRLMVETVTVSDERVADDNFDHNEFIDYAEERLKATARSQMERYLRSKGILF